VAFAHVLAGLGAGLLLGLLLDLPRTSAQRAVAVAGVASLLAAGTWLLLDRGLGTVAVGVLGGVLLALGTGLLSGLVGHHRSGRPPGIGPGGG